MLKLRSRGMAGLLGVLALSGLSVILLVPGSLWRPLPEPSTADEEGVLRWLALADLSQESPETSRKLNERIEQLAAAWTEPAAAASEPSLPEAYLERARENIAHLKKTWFQTTAESFATTPAENRRAFLDNRLQMVYVWTEIDRRMDAAAGSPTLELTDYLGLFFDDVERWTEAGGASRENGDAVLKAGFYRYLATYDLGQQTPAVHRRIAERLSPYLEDQPDLGSVSLELTAAEARLFWGNVELLAEAWFVSQAIRYSTLPAQQRAAALAGSLKTIRSLAAQLPAAGASAANSAGNSALSRASRWAARAAPAEQAAVRQFTSEVVRAWFKAAFGG